MSDDRTPRELGIGAVPEVVPASPAGAGAPARAASGATADGAEAMCQKADWLGPTVELPATAPPRPAESTRDRLRRWGREYGGYVAAGALALVVLICSVTGVTRADLTWHPGIPVAADPPSSTGQSQSAAAESSPAAPSPTPSRKPTARPAASSRPRTAASPTRSPSRRPSPTLLGPADGWGLSAMVDDYCRRRFDRSAVLVRPWQGSGAEDNWACQRRRRYDLIMANMTDACVLRYGNAVARYLDAKNPFSWRCYR
jgi:hypothetical protein